MLASQQTLLPLGLVLALLAVSANCFTCSTPNAVSRCRQVRWMATESANEDFATEKDVPQSANNKQVRWMDPESANEDHATDVYQSASANAKVTRRGYFSTVATVTTAGFLAAMAPLPEVSIANAAIIGGPVTVIGANGRTGYECVKALQSRSVPVRACSRTGVFRGETGPKVELRVCDVADASTIAPVVAGASAVIFAASASKEGGTPAVVDNAGVAAVARACIEAKVKQLVIVSSGAVTKPSSPVYLFLNVFGKIMEEKIKGEDTVRGLYAEGSPAEKEGLSYTIVRPGGLTEEESLGSDVPVGLELNQGDTKSGRIARADVANICVEALFYPELTGRTTLECYNADTGAPLASVGFSNILKAKTDKDNFVSGRECRGSTWKELFSGLEQD